MPIFDYKCESCGTFEHLQLPGENDLTLCPQCAKKVTKLLSTRMGVIYKGSGYYCTDNRCDKCSKILN